MTYIQEVLCNSNAIICVTQTYHVYVEKLNRSHNFSWLHRLRHVFSSYASKLKKMREILYVVLSILRIEWKCWLIMECLWIRCCRQTEDPNDEDLKKVHDYCDDMLQNLIAIKAVGEQQQQQRWQTHGKPEIETSTDRFICNEEAWKHMIHSEYE